MDLSRAMTVWSFSAPGQPDQRKWVQSVDHVAPGYPHLR
ncbi:unnamed protein product [Ectocarpus sp. CCAP 1310/34]|nr:unnamed protein product [Ectocarpus sp. CCAP 1310/34]